NYQRVLKHASLMLAVSKADMLYLRKQFKSVPVEFLPSFHPNYDLHIPEGTGDYVLYHGNLMVAENLVAAKFLIREVFGHSRNRLVLAGMNPPSSLQKLVKQFPNIEMHCNPSDEQLFNLIRNAQVHVLVTFQATGLKLKLLNTLYNGRHVVVNNAMLNGTGLEQLCHIANTPAEIISAVNTLFAIPVSEHQRQLRLAELENNFSNEKNAGKLIEFIFGNRHNAPTLTL
ncbi:MAG TPA: glycosyltransferase, partial [Bacteroidales bacterium]|nr:glycosyltransferase [Bacteroidales bacterium]